MSEIPHETDYTALVAIATALLEIFQEAGVDHAQPGGPYAIREILDPDEEQLLVLQNRWNGAIFSEWRADLRAAMEDWARLHAQRE